MHSDENTSVCVDHYPALKTIKFLLKVPKSLSVRCIKRTVAAYVGSSVSTKG